MQVFFFLFSSLSLSEVFIFSLKWFSFNREPNGSALTLKGHHTNCTRGQSAVTLVFFNV